MVLPSGRTCSPRRPPRSVWGPSSLEKAVLDALPSHMYTCIHTALAGSLVTPAICFEVLCTISRSVCHSPAAHCAGMTADDMCLGLTTWKDTPAARHTSVVCKLEAAMESLTGANAQLLASNERLRMAQMVSTLECCCPQVSV